MRTEVYTFVEVGAQVEDSRIGPDVVYINRGDARVDFKCPCGCGEMISLPILDESTPPNWEIDGNTLRPSVQRLDGCKSHFTITAGKVEFH